MLGALPLNSKKMHFGEMHKSRSMKDFFKLFSSKTHMENWAIITILNKQNCNSVTFVEKNRIPSGQSAVYIAMILVNFVAVINAMSNEQSCSVCVPFKEDRP